MLILCCDLHGNIGCCKTIIATFYTYEENGAMGISQPEDFDKKGHRKRTERFI